jgi:hypothetical protein
LGERAAPGARRPSFAGRGLQPWYVRVPVLLVAHLILRPLLWLLERAGLAGRFLRWVGERIQRDVVFAQDFGEYRPSSHDVIVCTYPKSGTNWMLQIAHQVATRGEGEFDHIHDVVPWPDFVDQDVLVPLTCTAAQEQAPTGMRVIKTHLPWERVPYSEAARYVCVLRDPKDTFVSMYHFTRATLFGPLMPSAPTLLELSFAPGAPLPWPEHTDGYWRVRDRPNVLVLTFEEMVADLAGTVRRVADFMGVELTEPEIQKVHDRSTFAYMKRHGERFSPPPVSPLAQREAAMIRRGKSGGSAEMLTPAQQRSIDEFCHTTLRALDSDLPYDELWGGRS